MSQKFELLNNLVKLAEKLGYCVNMISSYAEEVCLCIANNTKRYHVFLDLEHPQTNLIRQVLLEKGDREAEEKFYSSLKTFENALRSGK